MQLEKQEAANRSAAVDPEEVSCPRGRSDDIGEMGEGRAHPQANASGRTTGSSRVGPVSPKRYSARSDSACGRLIADFSTYLSPC